MVSSSSSALNVASWTCGWHRALSPFGRDFYLGSMQMSIGLLSVTASVYQMLRGAEMLFAALFSVTFLKRSAPILRASPTQACMNSASQQHLDVGAY